MNIEESLLQLKDEQRGSDKPWTLEAGLDFVRELEEFLLTLHTPEGNELCHCALGGSVLMSGESKKDLDVFVYAHCDEGYGHVYVAKQIAKHYGQPDLIECKFAYDKKDVRKMFLNGQRIDFFFL